MNNAQKPHAGKTSNIDSRPLKKILVLIRTGGGQQITEDGTEFRTSLDGTLHIYRGANVFRSFNVGYWLEVRYV